MKTSAFLSGLLLLACALPAQANLASMSAQVQDAAGVARTSFSSTERITLVLRVQNTAVSASSIQFTFEVKDPTGARRLYQTGNAAPGSVVGFTGATLRGVATAQFYSQPGVYTLTGTATLGVETVTASQSFTVLSPLITLSYPPNNARDLIDQPLIFRWVSSGASLYKVSVDDDPSFYNTLFTGQSVAGFLAYPLNPTDERQRLSAGQVYYWKVEGLDASGNVVAKAELPFSFTVKAQANQATSRDIAILDIEKVNETVPNAPGALPFAAVVKNQGGRPERNITLNFFADGAETSGSPKKIESLDAGETKRFVFPVRAPEEGKSLLLSAVIDFFDDNLQNNRFSKQWRADGQSSDRARLNMAEIWELVRRAVTDPQILAELEGYGVESMAGEKMSREGIQELMQAVKDGKARVTGVDLKPAN